MAENMITLTLAGPLSAAQAAKLRAKDVKDYPSPGMEITVPEADARALIDAGYAAGVEPADTEQVAKALVGGATTKAAKEDISAKTGTPAKS